MLIHDSKEIRITGSVLSENRFVISSFSHIDFFRAVEGFIKRGPKPRVIVVNLKVQV